MDEDKYAGLREPTAEEQAAQRHKEHMASIERREAAADGIAAYYQALIRRNVPDELARDLTRDYQAMHVVRTDPSEITRLVRAELEQLKREQARREAVMSGGATITSDPDEPGPFADR